MLRRQARLRREYIYRKSVEQRQKTIEDKKKRLKQAIDGIDFLVDPLRRSFVALTYLVFRKSKNSNGSSG